MNHLQLGIQTTLSRKRQYLELPMNIRKDDIVEIITGDDAGTRKSPVTGRVLRVLHEENKVVVEGINKVYKHLKPNRRNAQGGRLSREMPVSVSNVQLYCATCRRGDGAFEQAAQDVRAKVIDNRPLWCFRSAAA